MKNKFKNYWEVYENLPTEEEREAYRKDYICYRADREYIVDEICFWVGIVIGILSIVGIAAVIVILCFGITL